MRPELAGDVQGALVVFGGLLQFLRSNRNISDWFTLMFGAGVAVLTWALSVDWNGITDWQSFILKSVPAIAGCIGAVMGGTFMAAKAANSANNPAHPLVPATDSKG